MVAASLQSFTINRSIFRMDDEDPNEEDFQPSPLLRLFLGLHDAAADHDQPRHGLDSHLLYQYLTVRDLAQLPCLNPTVRKGLLRHGVEYTRCRDGHNYRVPFPGFPGLFGGNNSEENNQGLFPHQLASLAMMHRLENSAAAAFGNDDNNNTAQPPQQFGDLRGGILGDAPGLGKTVTVLALVASTAGRRPRQPSVPLNAANVAEGWTALTQNPAYQVDLNLALKPVREYGVGLDLLRDATIPLDTKKFATCRDFVRHVVRQLRTSTIVPATAVELFRRSMELLNMKLDKTQRNFLATARGRRFLLERQLVATGATLIVVPDALLEHWFEQTLHHLQLSRFVEENGSGSRRGGSGSQQRPAVPRGVIYLDGIGDIADATVPLGRVRLDLDMEPAASLMPYLMVVTTFSRCEREYRVERQAGRLQPLETTASSSQTTTMNHGSRKRPRRTFRSASSSSSIVTDAAPVSPLLQLRWLRLIVDEGHELGGHHANTLGLTRVLHEVAAERRWVLTGTPTTGDLDSAGYTAACLDQLQRLFCFLRHPEYGAVPPPQPEQQQQELEPQTVEDLERQQDAAHRQWERKVKIPFLERQESGRAELLRVLKGIMVMHQKDHIKLSQPIFLQGEVTVPVPSMVQTRVVQAASPREARLLLERYLESNEHQSLVDEAQGAYIVKSIRQAQEMRRQQLVKDGQAVEHDSRQGTVVEYNADRARIDRRPIKAVVYSSHHNNLLSVAELLYRKLDAENIAEMHGGVGDMSTELSRFRHGFKRVVTCPVCGGVNEVGDGRTKCRRTLMEVKERGGRGRRLLIEPERVLRAVPAPLGNVSAERMGDILHSEYRTAFKKWRRGDVLEVDARDPHPLLSARQSTQKWRDWGSQKCQRLADRDGHQGVDWFFGPMSDCGEEEVEDTILVTLEKWQPCCRFHNPRRWFKGPQFVDAPVETIKEDVFVLCLNAAVSHGLDLSFVTNIYLLEPIEDAALLQQVTSRAHRLGATGPVTVETVNVWQDIDDETRRATTETARGKDAASVSHLRKENQTGRAVCHYCCRSFQSMAKALEHERTKCSQNPNSSVEQDGFELASLYREIRPPQALAANQASL